MAKKIKETMVTTNKNVVLADQLKHAANPFSRMRGLLGTTSLPSKHALWLRPCASIHTIGMRYAIDALFLDKKKRVVKVAENIKPMRLCWAPLSTQSVLELRAGSIKESGVGVGDELQFSY